MGIFESIWQFVVESGRITSDPNDREEYTAEAEAQMAYEASERGEDEAGALAWLRRLIG